jgi:hypothetical protein
MCLPLSCDTFTLEVADGPVPLRIGVKSSDSPMFVDVVKPDGSSQTFYAEGGVRHTFSEAASGVYTIHVAQNERTQATHIGTAELMFPQPSSGAALPAALAVKVGTVSARRLRGSLRVGLRASAPLRRIAGVLRRGRDVVARGSVTRLTRTATLRMKLKGRPKPGTHTLRVTAIDAFGRVVARTVRVLIRR